MKLHLPRLLRTILLSCLALPTPLMAVGTSTTGPAFPDRYIDEDAGGTVFFSGSHNNGLYAESCHVITLLNASVSGGLKYSHLGNNGGDYYGMCLMYNSFLATQESGKLDVNVTSSYSSKNANGIAMSSGYLTNDGEMNVTTSLSASTSDKSAYGIYLRALYDTITGELQEDDITRFTNRGTMNIEVDGHSHSACGISAGAGDILKNEEGGTLTLQVSNTASSAHGIHLLDGATFSNKGFLTADVQGDNSSTSVIGIQLNDSSLNNEVGGYLRTSASFPDSPSQANKIVQGISLTNSQLTNKGTLEADAYFYNYTDHYPTKNIHGIRLAEASTLTNASGGVMNVSSFSRGHSASSHGIIVTDHSLLVNERGATLNVTSSAFWSSGGWGDDCNAYSILLQESELRNSGRAELTIELGNRPAYSTFPRIGYAACLSNSVLTNDGILISYAGSGSEESGSPSLCGLFLESASSVVNKNTMELYAGNGWMAYTYGARLYSGSSLLNEEGAHLSITTNAQMKGSSGSSWGENSGINLHASTLTNKGTVEMSVLNSNDTEHGGGPAYGIRMDDSDGVASSLVNQGTLKISVANPESGSAWGIQMYDSSFINNGVTDIEVETCLYSRGLTLNASTMHNTSASTLTISLKGNINSIDSYGIQLENSSTLTNEGAISINTARVSGWPAYGIQQVGSQLVNTGSLETQAESTWKAYGLHLEASEDGVASTLHNQGRLKALATSTKVGYTPTHHAQAICLFSSHLVNETGGSLELEGVAMSGRAYGLYLAAGSSVKNEAGASITLLASSQSAQAHGMYLSSSSLTNNGVISSQAQTSVSLSSYSNPEIYGIYLTGENATLTNAQSGHLTAAGSVGGISINSAASLHNEGVLQTDSVSLKGSSALYLHDGSTAGALTEGGTMRITSASAEETLYLGDSRILNMPQQTPGSEVTISSHLSLAKGTLQLQDDVRLKMGGDLTIGKDVAVQRNGHTLTVDNGAVAHQVTMGTKVAANWTGAVAVENEEGKLNLTSEGGNTMSNGTLKADHIAVASTEGTTMELRDMALTASGCEMCLTNIVVSGQSSFTSATGELTLNAEGVTFVLDASNSRGEGLEAQPFTMLLSADPLTETAVEPSVFYIDSDMLAGVNVAGNMTLDLSHWAEDIKAGGYESITLTFAEDMDFGEATTVQATLNGANFAVADYTADNMVQFNVANLPTDTVPEPATATLSLLALTALAARRRRK